MNTIITRLYFFGIFFFFLSGPCRSQVSIGFISPDTTCTGQLINITDTTTGGTTYYWNFCTGDANTNPSGISIGNPGGLLSIPTYLTLVKQDNDCFSFISCQGVGVVRYYHGNRFAHDPVSWVNLGTFGGLINFSEEGIVVKKDPGSGNWYGFVNSYSTMIRLNFGSSLWNTPTATDLNITPAFYMAHGLDMVNDNGNWVALVGCSLGASMFRLNFGNSLSNAPVVTNLGNLGCITAANAVCIEYENSGWYAMVVSGSNTLSRISFGSSLLNTPTCTNLGNPGGFNSALGLAILRDCDATSGYWVNYINPGQLGKLFFPTGITGTVTGTILGNIGDLNQPHSFSEVFRQNDTLFAYITNRPGTLTRLTFPPCNNSTVPSSNQYNPPPFSYNATGTYNIRLIVDEGLPTQASLCKPVVIVNPPAMDLGPDKTICQGTTTTLDAGAGFSSYLWSTGATTRTIIVGTGGTYWALGIKYGCQASDTVLVVVRPQLIPTITGPSAVCAGSAGIIYTTESSMNNYTWNITAGGTITSGSGTNAVTVTWNTPGPGTISVSYTDPSGCAIDIPAVLNVTVDTLPGPAGNIRGPAAVCSRTNGLVYSVLPVGNASGYVWILPAGFSVISGQGTMSIIVNVSDSATGGVISVYGVNVCGAGPVSSPFLVSVNQSATASAGEDISSCETLPVLLSGSNAGHYTSLQWMTSGNGTFDNAAVLHPTYFPGTSDIQAKQVILSLFAYSASPCYPDSDKLVLAIEKKPIVTPGPDGYICQGMSYTVHGFGITNSSSFSWESNGKGQLTGTGTLNPVYTPAVDELGSVKVTLKASGIYGCSDSSASAHMQITIYSSPGIKAGSEQSVKYDSSAVLGCETSGGSGNFSFDWSPAALLVDNTLRNPHTVNLIKDAMFIITITDKVTGCTATDSTRIRVTPGPGDEDCIVIYNVITPNGDGVNDQLIIDCIEDYPENTLELFNRWGDQVNSFVNYNNEEVVWRGTTSKGEILPDGTYFFILQIRDGKKYTGWVFLRSGTN